MPVAIAGGRQDEYSNADIDSGKHDAGRTKPNGDAIVTNP